MGYIREIFCQGDVNGCQARILGLWASRHSHGTFTATDADDVVWLLGQTSESPAMQLTMWPKALGLLTRWTFMLSRRPSSDIAGAALDTAKLNAFQQWLGAYLQSRRLLWAVHAPALLFLAVASSLSRSLQPQPQQQQPQKQREQQPSPSARVAYEALLAALRQSPTPDLLLPSADAVTDLSTATELVLERLLADGDSRSASDILAALLAAIGGSLASLLVSATGASQAVHTPCTAASAASATWAAAGRPEGFPPVVAPQPTAGMAAAADAAGGLAEAAAREAVAAGLAALHVACRQLGAACVRAVAAAPAAAVVGPAVAGAVGDIGRGVTTSSSGADSGSNSEVLLGAAERLCSTTAAAAGALAAARPMGATMGQAFGGPADGGGTLPPPSPFTGCGNDPRVAAAVTAAAAGGLLEGCVSAARLHPPHTLCRLLTGLEPSLARLAAALQHASSAAAGASTAAPAAEGPNLASGAGAAVGGPSAQGDAIAVEALSMAVGYSWARLRALPAVQQWPPAAAPVAVAERMSTAAAAAAGTVALYDAAGAPGPWHPARGSLAMLLVGSLGLSRVLQMAEAVCSPAAAAELLDSHTHGPLFADVQLLARTALETTKLPTAAPGASAFAPAPEREPGQPSTPGATSWLATHMLYDTAGATRRLHLSYGKLADSAAGQAWLAALPPPASGALREVLDRAFVCVISVLTAAYGIVAAAASPPAPPAPPLPPSRGSAAATRPVSQTQLQAAVTALGSLGDVQFCGLQLRAHGDLVAQLTGDVAASPAAAAVPLLLALLPCYPAFAAVYGSGHSAVAVSRLAFLLPVVAASVPSTPPAELGGAAAAVLPYIYALLKGAPEGVTQAAHAVWAALLANLCEGVAAGGTAAGAMAGCGGGAASGRSGPGADGVGVAISMVPYYLERTCQAPCCAADLELVEWGLRQVLKSLPVGHPMKLWCLARLTEHVAAWAAEGQAATAAQGASDAARESQAEPLSAGRSAEAAAAASSTGAAATALLQRGGSVVAALVLMLDFTLLPRALQILSNVMMRVGRTGRIVVLQQLHDVWLQSNDYARKALLDGWLQTVVTDAGTQSPSGGDRLSVLLV